MKLERSCKRTRDAAAGPDGIAGRMLAKLYRRMSNLLCPLITKVFLRTQGPIQWKGSFYWSLLKSRDPGDRNCYRSILGSSQLDKRSRSLMRTQLASYLPKPAGPRQCGGMPGAGADCAALELRLHQQLAQARRLYAMFAPLDAAQAIF
eukprot:6599634-Pyramimonas_sp.AAC.1